MSASPEFNETLLTGADLRRLIPVSAMSIWRWRRAGAIPEPIVVRGRNYWKASEVRAWMEAQKSSAPARHAAKKALASAFEVVGLGRSFGN